jgi:short-subunit dehydrogenase
MTTVLITGVTDGIGRALAQHDAAAGAHVVGVGRRPVEAAPPGVFPPAAYCQIDLAQPDAGRRVASILDALGIDQLDVLIHNAAAGWYGPVAEQPAASIDELLAVNLAAPLRLTTALLAAGKLAPGGSLVFISSLSRLLSYPGASVYAASKDGLASYARSLGVALAPQGIHVLTVYPGPTRTAHARRYSPDNRREARRMAPDVLAAAVAQAVQRRRRVLIPGAGNRMFASVGRWWPQMGEWAMKRTIWEKLAQ